MSTELRQYGVAGLVALTTMAGATFGSTDQAEAQQRSHVGMPQQFKMEIPVDPTNIGRGTRTVDINCGTLGERGALTSTFIYQTDAGGGMDNPAADRGEVWAAVSHIASLKGPVGQAYSSGPHDHQFCIPAAVGLRMSPEWRNQNVAAIADDAACPHMAALRSCLARTGINTGAANFISDAYILNADGSISLDTSAYSRSPGAALSRELAR